MSCTVSVLMHRSVLRVNILQSVNVSEFVPDTESPAHVTRRRAQSLSRCFPADEINPVAEGQSFHTKCQKQQI